MRLPSSPDKITAVAVPLSALRTQRSVGAGEFADLIPFAEFCSKCGISLVQLLPINDTGTESSPYSALSAFALNPLFVSLEDIPEAGSYRKEIAAIRARHEGKRRFDYRAVRQDKVEFLHRVYDEHEGSIVKDESLTAWIGQNPWIAEYAVFMNFKRRNLDASWKEWQKFRAPSKSELRARWESPSRRGTHLFYAWMQMRLDEQMRRAESECARHGVHLKGDIPILMNEDSCDAWAHPELFRDDLRAGNPPDALNPRGQNWGFPIYNWQNLREEGYAWWKDRLALASRYYRAYRLDHILGFFRLWSIPQDNESGMLGWPNPHSPITSGELAERGFVGDRLRWICEPHVPTSAIEAVNGGDYLAAHGILSRALDRLGSEELWLFKPSVAGERSIRECHMPEACKDALVDRWSDRLVQITGRDADGRPLYYPVWHHESTTAWKSLSDSERANLSALFSEKKAESERLWEEQGKDILREITDSADMLACAEDLGAIPDCVPASLRDLGILSLKVMRWERRWDEPGQPMIPPSEYPELSVAASSVHDSSTLRGWWEKEGGAKAMGREGDPFSPEIARATLLSLAASPARVLSIPLQDYLALCDDYSSPSSDDDRVNVPGTVSAFNWTWRIPVTIEELKKNKRLAAAISEISKARQQPETGK
jgi:4-alpha-glucanotransferase